MRSERKQLTYAPPSDWQRADWQAARPYCRALMATIIAGISLGVAYLFTNLPAAVYFGLGGPLLLAYYLCVSRIRKIAIQAESRNDTPPPQGSTCQKGSSYPQGNAHRAGNSRHKTAASK